MIKCDNCANNAVYTQADPGASPVNYCGKCLPHWLHIRALAGEFPLVERIHEAPVEEAPVLDTPKPSKRTVKQQRTPLVVDVEPVVEETATEPEEAAVSDENS